MLAQKKKELPFLYRQSDIFTAKKKIPNLTNIKLTNKCCDYLLQEDYNTYKKVCQQFLTKYFHFFSVNIKFLLGGGKHNGKQSQ